MSSKLIMSHVSSILDDIIDSDLSLLNNRDLLLSMLKKAVGHTTATDEQLWAAILSLYAQKMIDK